MTFNAMGTVYYKQVSNLVGWIAEVDNVNVVFSSASVYGCLLCL